MIGENSDDVGGRIVHRLNRLAVLTAVMLAGATTPVFAKAEAGWVCSLSRPPPNKVESFFDPYDEMKKLTISGNQIQDKSAEGAGLVLTWNIVENTDRGLIAIWSGIDESNTKVWPNGKKKLEVFVSTISIDKDTGEYLETTTVVENPAADKSNRGKCVNF